MSVERRRTTALKRVWEAAILLRNTPLGRQQTTFCCLPRFWSERRFPQRHTVIRQGVVGLNCQWHGRDCNERLFSGVRRLGRGLHRLCQLRYRQQRSQQSRARCSPRCPALSPWPHGRWPGAWCHEHAGAARHGSGHGHAHGGSDVDSNQVRRSSNNGGWLASRCCFCQQSGAVWSIL